jgi:hypothetical protein
MPPPDPRTFSPGNQYVLNESDRNKFKELYEDYLRRNPQLKDSRGGPRTETDDAQQSSDFYICKVTTTITPLSGNTAGKGTGEVYQLLDYPVNPTLTVVEGLKPGDEQTIYTTGAGNDTGEWVQIAKDKFGRWWVVSRSGGAETFLAVLVDKIQLNSDHVAYSWARVVEAPPWGYVEACPYERGCPEHTPAYHQRGGGPHMPVVGVRDNSTGTGTADEQACETVSSRLCPGPAFIDPLSIVRMRRYGPEEDTSTGTIDPGTGTGTGAAEGGYCLFTEHPWISHLEVTPGDVQVVVGAVTRTAKVAYQWYLDQTTGLFMRGRPVYFIEPINPD